MNRSEISFVAHKKNDPRYGQYYSLCASVQEGSEFEWARVRKERRGWNVWAQQREDDLMYKASISQASLDVPLAAILATLKRAYFTVQYGEEVISIRITESCEEFNRPLYFITRNGAVEGEGFKTSKEATAAAQALVARDQFNLQWREPSEFDLEL